MQRYSVPSFLWTDATRKLHRSTFPALKRRLRGSLREGRAPCRLPQWAREETRHKHVTHATSTAERPQRFGCDRVRSSTARTLARSREYTGVRFSVYDPVDLASPERSQHGAGSPRVSELDLSPTISIGRVPKARRPPRAATTPRDIPHAPSREQHYRKPDGWPNPRLKPRRARSSGVCCGGRFAIDSVIAHAGG